MYTPRWFKEERLSVLHQAIERISFGTLTTITPAGLVASHIPMLVDRTQGQYGAIYGHIARGNTQWRQSSPDVEGLATFVGPDAYISPSWYESKQTTGKVVPTWNYVAVHAHGPVVFFEDSERLRKVVTRLTDHHEAAFPKQWHVTDAPSSYIDGELKSIVGFEMQIRLIEGKWKLGQNRSPEDRHGVVRGLGELNDPSAADVAKEIREREPAEE